ALYRFAPRRARLSAERCVHVLRSAGLSQATLELSSMRPSAGSDADVGVIPLAKSPTRTTGPAAVSMKEVPVQGSGRSKTLVMIGVVAVAAAATFAFLRQRGTPSGLTPAPAVAAPTVAP